MATGSGDRPCPACGGDGEPIPEYRGLGLARCADCGLAFHARRSQTGGDYLSDEPVQALSRLRELLRPGGLLFADVSKRHPSPVPS